MPKRLGITQGTDPLHTDHIYHIYSRTLDNVLPFERANFCDLFIKLLYHCKTYNTSYSKHKEMWLLKGKDKITLTEPSRKTWSLPGALQKEVPVKLHAYTIMPNHFHLLIEQLTDGGISHYMGRILKSFTYIYNKKVNRRGTLWESKFKSKVILDDAYYLQCIRYFHINPLLSTKLNILNLEDYSYSSYLDAVKIRDGTLCDHSFLYRYMNAGEYRKFVNAKIKQTEITMIKEIAIEKEVEECFNDFV